MPAGAAVPATSTTRARSAARLDAQLLRTPSASSTEEVLERVLAVQAQDHRGARLAVRARSRVGDVAEVDDALTRRRSAVVSWLNRGTLHLVRSEDYWWLHPLTTPQLRTGNERRLGQLGLDRHQVDLGVETILAAVRAEGPRTRDELRVALDVAGVPHEGQVLVHLLAAATLGGHLVRGPVRAGQPAFAEVESWLGPAPEPIEEPEALSRLARRYLAGHGPASASDLAKWAGVTLGRAREGFRSIRAECRELGDGLVDLDGRWRRGAGPGRRMPAPRLLGPFDPVLHGWADRSPLVGPHRGVVTSNGVFRATALVAGRVVGTWGLAEGRVRLRLLEPIAPAAERALRREAEAVLAFLGLPPAPLAVSPAGGGDAPQLEGQEI